MSLSLLTPEFIVERNDERCIRCQVCVRQCANLVHTHDQEEDRIVADDSKCVNCHRCVVLCPTRALTIRRNPLEFKENALWTASAIREIYKQAETGGILLTGMGNDRPYPVYWDRMLLNASQVTNPSIDPLREPMELKTMLGRKPEVLRVEDGKIKEKLPPQINLEIPVMFSAMSFGSISFNACQALAMAASETGTMYNTGEGGFHKDLRKYGKNTIVQVASGRFGVDADYLEAGVARVIVGTAAIEDEPFTRRVLQAYGEKIAIGLDCRNGLVATRGWLTTTDVKATELAKRLVEYGAQTFIYTDIARDGTLTGPNVEEISALAIATGKSVIASGGVSSLDDLLALSAHAANGVSGAIVGKALYTEAFTLKEALGRIGERE